MPLSAANVESKYLKNSRSR